jgi:hypothetical protein
MHCMAGAVSKVNICHSGIVPESPNPTHRAMRFRSRQDFPEKRVAFRFASVADTPWRAGMTRFLTF